MERKFECKERIGETIELIAVNTTRVRLLRKGYLIKHDACIPAIAPKEIPPNHAPNMINELPAAKDELRID